ncbi:MAG: DUF5318 domain-containing protein [Actinomycetota bacterium]|nr:DUF5318 domain-containing protein [Actinomycetota bacterium]
MPFGLEKLGGESGRTPGEVDYRLARQAVLSGYRKGRLARHEVCDAQPELLRAARNVGEESSQACPICDDAKVVLVTYVFGPRLPANGRCVTTVAEMKRLARGAGERVAYVVEVCPGCRWNHLARTFPLGPGASPRSAPSG